MIRNPYAADAVLMKEKILQAGRGRATQQAGPADPSSAGDVGSVTSGGDLRLYGLLGITIFEEEFMLS
jgi:hypothetical protein